MTVELAGFRLREAERGFPIGAAPLDEQPYLEPHRLRLYPAN